MPNFSRGLNIGGALSPTTDDGGTLGSSVARWSDALLATGAKIDFGGNMSIQHAQNNIKFLGDNWIFNALYVRPDVDAATSLGAPATAWKAAYISSGGKLDFGAGNYVVTHSVGALDFSGAAIFAPGSVAPALSSNGQVTFELTNDTTLTFKAKGSDGSIRSGTITLAP